MHGSREPGLYEPGISADGKPINRDLIILVHGTGAADEADRGSRWWQLESAFETAFSKLTESFAETVKPFHWSGANSELHRRAAGIALLERLRKLDVDGRRYHLVGHSHGGSIIWHALVASTLRGSPLSGLRSWSTIGTPFMHFRAERPSIWRWITLSLLALAVCWIVGANDPAEWGLAVRRLWEKRQWLDIAYVGAIFGALLFLATWSLLRVIAPLVRYANESSLTAAAEKSAKERYGSRWLALWHPLDEPINALSGTLGEAPQIAPRLPPDAWVLSLIPFLGPLAYRVATRAADEFAWLQIIRRAQGSNLPGHRLLRVGRAPVALNPGYAAIDQVIATKIEKAADTKAVDSVARFRALLETAYDKQASAPIFGQIATVVSFQELIHTSYFDHSEIGSILVAHIHRHAGSGDGETRALPPALADVRTPPLLTTADDDAALPKARPLNNLELIAALAIFVLPAVLLLLTGNAMFDAKIAPETDQFQIKTIAAALNKPHQKSENSRDSYGEIIVRLARLGEINDPIAALANLVEQDTRKSGAAIVAEYLGAKGDWRSIEKLIVTPSLVQSDGKAAQNLSEQKLRLKAVFGAVAAGHTDLRRTKSLHDMIDAIDVEASSLLKTETDPKRIEFFPWRDWGNSLVKLKEYDRVKRLLASDGMSADPPRQTAADRARCALANALRTEQQVDALQISLREWAEICRKTSDADAHFVSLLEESLRAPGPDAETLRQILSSLDGIERLLNDAVAAIRQRDPEAKPPELHVNIAGLKIIKKISLLYCFGLTHGTQDQLTKFNRAIDSFLNVPDEALKLERVVVVLRLIERIKQESNAFPRDPRWKEILTSSAELVLKRSASILGKADTSWNFDERVLFSQVPRLLVAAGLDGIARQFLRDLQWRLREEYKDALGAFATLYLAAAAKTINYNEYGLERLSEGLSTLQVASNTRSDKEEDLAEYAMLAALTAGVDSPELARRALRFAEYNLDLIKNSEKRTEFLPDMVRLWVSLGELPKARALADSAPASDTKLGLYVPILDKVIADRKIR